MSQLITIPIIMSRNSGILTIVFPAGSVMITESHPNRESIINMIFPDGEEETVGNIPPLIVTKEEFDQLKSLTDLNKTLSDNGFVIDNNIVYYNGNELNGVIADKVRSIICTGKDLRYLKNFIDKLYENDSYVRDQLYGFLENNNFVINEKGNFYAYKYVNSNYTDCYTGTIDNSPGSVVTMPRDKVNDNPRETCSTGLHACSYSYIENISIKSTKTIVVLEIDPRDVISIPVDYNNAKMRCCKYIVVGDIKDKMTSININPTRNGKSKHTSDKIDILAQAETIEDLQEDIDKLKEIFSNDVRLSTRINNGIIKNKPINEIIASCFKARPKSAKARALYVKYGHIEMR